MNIAKKILIVDDEPKIVEVIKSYLENSGYIALEAFTGKEALELFDKHNPALVILDLMLPDISGEQVCITLRAKSKVPIIMLTAKVEEDNILKGLNIGADDYVIKPFSPKQLLARIMAVLRRTENGESANDNLLSFCEGDLIIDQNSYDIRKNGISVNLTPNEFKLLNTLAKYPKKVFTREELITYVMGEDFDGFDRIIDTHIKNLRQKIELDPRNPKYIITIHGVGYRFGGESI